MQADVRIASVETTETRSGHTRYVVSDDSGREYTTFRPQIGAAAKAAEGQRARIEFHEQQRGGFTNVYLDKVEPAPERPGDDPGAEPEELFHRLKPFKDLVADDIRDGDDDDAA